MEISGDEEDEDEDRRCRGRRQSMSVRGETFGKELEKRTARKEAPRDGSASDGGATRGETVVAVWPHEAAHRRPVLDERFPFIVFFSASG